MMMDNGQEKDNHCLLASVLPVSPRVLTIYFLFLSSNLVQQQNIFILCEYFHINREFNELSYRLTIKFERNDFRLIDANAILAGNVENPSRASYLSGSSVSTRDYLAAFSL